MPAYRSQHNDNVGACFAALEDGSAGNEAPRNACYKIRGVNINWQVMGLAGPWVMLAPGWRRGHDDFVPLAQKLAGLGHRVVLHDRRNTGASDVLIEGEEGEEVIWTEDMYSLMRELDALPAFFGGGSSGARTSILFTLRHPEVVRGLLLLRVTGGAFAAGRLPENYYGQFIRAAHQGGMDAVCATEQWAERIKANPHNGDYLRRLPAEKFIDVLTRWRRRSSSPARTCRSSG